MSVRDVRTGRGVPLVAAWVVLVLFEVFALVINVLDWQSIVAHGQPDPWIPVVKMVLLVIILVALGGVWFWQRKAVYVLAVGLLVSAVFDSWFGLASLALLIRLVIIAALAWCIQRKWAAFR